jgi:hypothetical protein
MLNAADLIRLVMNKGYASAVFQHVAVQLAIHTHSRIGASWIPFVITSPLVASHRPFSIRSTRIVTFWVGCRTLHLGAFKNTTHH